MDESSPITIIVGALVATLAIGIAAEQVNDFGQSASDRDDNREVRELVGDIQEECERLDELGELQYSTSTTIELRMSGFDIDDQNDVFIYEPDGEADRIEIECNPGVSFTSNVPGSYDVPSGEHDVSIEDANGEIQVTFN